MNWSVWYIELITLIEWKEKNMIIWREAEKDFASLSTSIHRENFQQSMKGTYLYTLKFAYEKPTANIIINSGIWKVFILMSGKRQGCPLLWILFDLILEFVVEDRQEKEEKVIQIRKVKNKSLFSDNIIISVEKCKHSTKNG